MKSTELTVETAAPAFEGLLSAEDGTQEPEKKEAEESTEAEPESEAEGEPAEESEESEEAEPEEESEAEPSYTVKIDGKDAKVPLKELLSGYQRQSDYTRKTQQLAEERRELDSIKAEREHYAAQLDKVKALIEQAQPKEPDWDNLIAQDPIGAYRLKLQHDRHQEQLRAIEAEQAQVRAAQEADEAKAQAKYLAEQQAKLLEAIPEWKDAKKASADKLKMVQHAETYGFSPEEIGAVTDARTVQILRDAMQWREMQAKLAKVKPTFQQPAIKTARGGTSSQSPANSLARDMKRLKQTGDTADAAAAFMHFIE